MHQRGFTLIEVLVATVILAFGLLGIAGMQLSGIRAAQGSYLRSQAVAVMTDFAERMHANQPGSKKPPDAAGNPTAGEYQSIDSNAINCATPPTICAQENGGAAPVACNATQLATYDAFVVTCGLPSNGGARVGGLASLLPSGRMRVTCLNTAGAAVTGTACNAGTRRQIQVDWQDRADIHQTSSTSTTGAQQAVLRSVFMTIQP